jgi:hypothetical protein
MQHLEYLWRAPSMPSWENACKSGQCNEVQARWWEPKPVEELYDIIQDPWEVNNLAGDPAYQDRLVTMRNACFEKGISILDAGFLPEAERNIRSGEIATYDYMRSGEVPYQEIVDVAAMASLGDPDNLDLLVEKLEHEDSGVRYWAARGLRLLLDHLSPHVEQIRSAAFDPSLNVSATCAEILYLLGEREMAVRSLSRVLQSEESKARLHALNCIDHVGGTGEEFVGDCIRILKGYGELDRGRQYDARLIKWLFQKWEINPVDQGIEFTW